MISVNVDFRKKRSDAKWHKMCVFVLNFFYLLNFEIQSYCNYISLVVIQWLSKNIFQLSDSGQALMNTRSNRLTFGCSIKWANIAEKKPKLFPQGD